MKVVCLCHAGDLIRIECSMNDPMYIHNTDSGGRFPRVFLVNRYFSFIAKHTHSNGKHCLTL